MVHDLGNVITQVFAILFSFKSFTASSILHFHLPLSTVIALTVVQRPAVAHRTDLSATSLTPFASYRTSYVLQHPLHIHTVLDSVGFLRRTSSGKLPPHDHLHSRWSSKEMYKECTICHTPSAL